ncbi:hypothetical protein ASPVEDRAFT_877842 [Aspergillus versicolor CBS 583.65]|uniref:Carboxylic ester hydrolase n=1 Tax=Aspergillus versicolor CBS 583.65 TaxID=1036611 RepID=A0A1L9Q1Y6_ASPVE|nr:uncharacterized protein ASPVEDRAFT_877842 [Aspergillus versicolor CBS 583.65]OJJ07741.1 hypothetical protein ASPVEDRAFT_877842 [Aspergillus versicolor CBS 583.65]
MLALYIAVTLNAIGSVRCANVSNPIVDLGYAKYRGSYNATSGTNEWHGIRYAQPPLGEFRWQAPRDIEYHYNHTLSMLDATAPGPICVQGAPAWLGMMLSMEAGIVSNDPIEESEDCLSLDVMVPAKPASTSLPVLVQIHGGGYTSGYGRLVPGNALVFQSRGDLIYVSVQYRLGAYGFLGGVEVTENGVTNVGLLDQRAALNWVQRHIASFGGDPAKVTIIGGSAGGGSVIDQMIMYGGDFNPPFRAAIAEYPWMQPYHNNTALQRQYNQLLSIANCSNIACLRGLSEEDLANAVNQTYYKAYAHGEYGYGDFYYGPYVDRNIIRDLPSQEFKTGHFSKVPLMTNREGYEGATFTNSSEVTPFEMQQGLETLFPNAKQSFFNRLYQLYPRAAYNSTFFQRQQLFGDFIISCPTYYFGAAVSDWGNRVYKMIFDAGTQGHGSLIPFTETVNLEATTTPSYYISFATSLDPNAIAYINNSLPHWPPYQGDDSGSFTVLNVTYGGVEAAPDNDASPQCDFFHSQSYVVRN